MECKANSPCTPFLVAIYVELKNPIESTVALNKERVLIGGVDCRTLSALGMPYSFGDPFSAPALGCSLSREM